MCMLGCVCVCECVGECVCVQWDREKKVEAKIGYELGGKYQKWKFVSKLCVCEYASQRVGK